MDTAFWDAVKGWGPLAFVLIFFLFEKFWPFLVERWFPFYVEEKKSSQQEHVQQEQRSAFLFEQTVKALTALQVTLTHINDNLAEQREIIARINEDVSGLYGYLGQRRTPRNDLRPKEKERSE